MKDALKSYLILSEIFKAGILFQERQPELTCGAVSLFGQNNIGDIPVLIRGAVLLVPADKQNNVHILLDDPFACLPKTA